MDAPQAAQYRRRYKLLTAGLDAGQGKYHIDIPCSIDEELALLREAGFACVEVLDDHIRPSGSRAVLKAFKDGHV